MKNFYYACEVNLKHSKSPVEDLGQDVRAVSYISRPFPDSESAIRSIEEDIVTKMGKELQGGSVPLRVSETNPFELNPIERIEEKAKEDESFARYLSTWDQDLLARMTVMAEEDDNEALGTTYDDMPPKNFIMRYYIREFEDGIELPASINPSQLLYSDTIQ